MQEIQEEGRREAQASEVQTIQLQDEGKPSALDFFSGTGSVAKVLRERGYCVTTLDMQPKYGADIVVDIREWNFEQIPPLTFEIIVASPPCTEFSKAKTVGEKI